MWDFLKKVGGAMVERGAEYMTQVVAWQEISNSPTMEAAIQRLQAHVASLETQKSFDMFMAVLAQRQQEAWQALEHARENPFGESWGGFIEDRIAQLEANIRAGNHAGNSPHVQQAEQMVQALQQAEAVARQTWDAVQAQRSAPEPSAADRIAAFQEHQRAFLPRESVEIADRIVGNTSSQNGPLTEIEAAQLMLEADKRLMPAMVAATRAGADEALVAQLDEIYEMYARIVQDGPQDARLTPRKDVRNKMGQAREFAGNAWESMRDDNKALIYFRKALKQYRKAEATAEIARLEKKLARLEEYISGDTDAAMTRLLEPRDPGSLDEVERLLQLAALKSKQGDTYGAREDLHLAESLLEAQGHRPPAAGGLAQDLMASLAALQSGEPAGGTAIETSMKLRGIYQSLYGQLAQSYQDADPDAPDFAVQVEKADQYQAKWEAMDSRAENDAFSSQMQVLLNNMSKGL